MSEGNNPKGNNTQGVNKDVLKVVALAVGIMALLYGYLAYAAPAIESDLNFIVNDLKSNRDVQLDEQAVKNSAEIRKIAVEQQTDSIATDLYGMDMRGTEDTMTEADSKITTHFSKYCAGGNLETGNCPEDPLFKFADANVAILLSGTRYENTARTDAVWYFLNNLFNMPGEPLVTSFKTKRPLSAGKLTNTPADKDVYAKALSDEAFLSVMRESFAEMVAKRMPVSGGASEMEFMEKEAIKRAKSSKWREALAQATPEQVQKDMALMQAQQLWMDYQRYRQMERLEAVMSSLAMFVFRTSKTAQTQISAGKQPSKDETEEAKRKIEEAAPQ